MRNANVRYEEYDPRTFWTIRRLLGVSQRELADICGMSRQNLYLIEAGKVSKKNTPSVTLVGITLDSIAEEMGLSGVVNLLKKGSSSDTCKVVGTATDGLMDVGNERKRWEFSCGHSVTLDGTEAIPLRCAVCGRLVIWKDEEEDICDEDR